MDKSLSELQNQASQIEQNTANKKMTRDHSRASSLNIGSVSKAGGVNQDVPKSISRQLLDTLSKWQPVNSKWTIKELYERVSQSVTEFLKIPMLEMSSEEFYSLYMDVDNQESGLFKPLPVPKRELEDGDEEYDELDNLENNASD